MSSATRGTIFLEKARVLSHLAHDGAQFVLRLAAPKCAAQAAPGSFVHLTCDAAIPMRRPLSIMRAAATAGWIELLYKVSGPGLAALAARRKGEEVSVLGPIGQPFSAHAERPRTLLLGGGVGIPPMVFLAERLSAARAARWKPLVLMGSEVPFPFRARPSTMIVAGIPAGSLACMPLLEEWGVPSRLASGADFPGCFPGFVTELAEVWLGSLTQAQLAEVEIFSCGPTAMLKASAQLAQRFGVPCQVSLEEFMACAVGGCAGCTVAVRTADGPAMKRVCVDGPVFDAYAVF
ncbi:MAG TPA: dihydroorotate dehydrogenase electron transfer subunit [Steroidobacteraceae bacterium]|jgi:dihydroorotate dehydrogenase electron transfer subunit|nr:dihydroorotate dehydrogenase electron transfer subunit [Steroidobacteraceae bacterium]